IRAYGTRHGFDVSKPAADTVPGKSRRVGRGPPDPARGATEGLPAPSPGRGPVRWRAARMVAAADSGFPSRAIYWRDLVLLSWVSVEPNHPTCPDRQGKQYQGRALGKNVRDLTSPSSSRVVRKNDRRPGVDGV